MFGWLAWLTVFLVPVAGCSQQAEAPGLRGEAPARLAPTGWATSSGGLGGRLARGLAFPDGVSVLPGDLEELAAQGELRSPPPAGGPARARVGNAPHAEARGSSGRVLATLAALAALVLAGRLARD